MDLARRIYDKVLYDKIGYRDTGREYIFGVGLSKTGTTSLDDALTEIGLPSCHLPPSVKVTGVGQIEMNWPWWLCKYQAATDLSIAAIFRQLHATFPNARFIHTHRDLDSWLDSCRRHFTLELLQERVRQRNFWVMELTLNFYGSVLYDEALFTEAYRRHEADVDAFFADKKLLRMDVTAGDGWDKLCPFLGVDIPDRPFPTSNKGIPAA